MMQTYYAKRGDVESKWYIVDAAGISLGRTASQVATILQGKNKPVYAPHMDVGDYVVVVNAAKVKLTGKKLDSKLYHRHSGWVGGLTSTSLRDVLKSDPTKVIKHAVRGMLPKNKLGRSMLRKLKIHPGPCPEHGYQAQKAEPLEFEKSEGKDKK